VSGAMGMWVGRVDYTYFEGWDEVGVVDPSPVTDAFASSIKGDDF